MFSTAHTAVSGPPPVLSPVLTSVTCRQPAGIRLLQRTITGFADRAAGPASRVSRRCRLVPQASLRNQNGDGASKLWQDLLGDGLWAPPTGELHIRPIQDNEWPEVADIQAMSFHTPMKIGMMNAVAYNSFRVSLAKLCLGMISRPSPPAPALARKCVAVRKTSTRVGTIY